MDISGPHPLTKSAIEVASALKELHGLPQQEAGERIAGREGSEYEEPVSGNPERRIDLFTSNIGPEFQVVAATGQGDRVRSLIVVLISILRPCNRIAE